MPSNGSRDLALLAARLKVTGNRTLRLQMTRGLRAAAKPLIEDVKTAAREKLPRSGGLNEQVAGQKVSVSVRTGARTAGVRLLTSAPDTAQTDAGFVRHPTFGRRGKGQWRRQEIPAAKGWWSDTLANDAPKVTAEMLAVMEAVAIEIQAGL